MEKDKRWKVKFRDVAPTYFPQTRVDCRYTLSSEHQWRCRDWIGIFQNNEESLEFSLVTPASYCRTLVLQGLPVWMWTSWGGLRCEFLSPSALQTSDELVTLEEERNGEETKRENLMLVVVCKSHEKLSEELNSLISERAENQQRIKELEGDLSGLMQQRQDSEGGLDRMKERVKKLTVQRKAEEDERRNLQMEVKRCHEELQVLQERLETSDCSVEVLRRDLSELGALQSQNQTELHQIRLQAAQTTLQLSQANLNLREGQAGWAKERENLRRNSELDKERVQKLSHELQKKEEWLEEERTEREKLEQELGNEKACNRSRSLEMRKACPDPDSPSSGYQTHSPSSQSQPSSPEELSLDSQHRAPSSDLNPIQGPTSSSPKHVYQFPELKRTHITSSEQSANSHSFTGRRSCSAFTRSGGMVLLCKGFFRRSIQQNISYKMCVKNEKCQVVRMNRNRCQHCRFKKCLSVGMSRDAVRFGRIPKREKQRLLDEMQSLINTHNSTDVDSAMPSKATPTDPTTSPQCHQSDEVMGISVKVKEEEKHVETNKKVDDLNAAPSSSHKSQPPPVPPYLTPTPPCSTQARVTFTGSDIKRETPCPWRPSAGAKVLACPLNSCPVYSSGVSTQQVWDSFSQCFSPAVKDVVEFSRNIPGFYLLSQDDQIRLLKSGTFQVLMVRFSSLFDTKQRAVRFSNGELYPLASLRALGMGPLLDAMFEFSEKLSVLELEADELSLFMAVVLVSADRAGVSNMATVEKLQDDLIDGLRTLITSRRLDDSEIFHKLLLCLPDLRTLDSLHSEKLSAFHIDL
ncbi:Nuclear hormone receptor E75 [Bagarius yarrelli]|uniref:Nuclear hormone receptor E75 n=1 Tax=Bagarius yarrelli TaxID=175774 RepID=A0A556V4M0_BAGYA|nr:Nuclear hormone receptor E75 [Bagarius yarrelli]